MRRFGYSIFCDDIRNEVGGKLSFIGCYNAVMFVPSQFPFVLPKFCVHFHIMSPATQPYERIVARCYVPGHPDPIMEESIEPPASEQQSRLVAELESHEGAPRYIAASASLIMAPFQIEAAGLIRVRALVDDSRQEMNLGSLRIVSTH